MEIDTKPPLALPCQGENGRCGFSESVKFGELEKKILDNADRYEDCNGVKVDLDFSTMKLVEEVGELYQAIMIHQKKSRPEKHLDEKESRAKMAYELADVAGMLVVLADKLDVDLEKALVDKWVDHIDEK